MEIEVRALLFDMDGTLIDSFAPAHRAWDGWADRHGLPTPVLTARTHGRPRPQVVRMLMSEASDEEVEQHARAIQQAELSDVKGVVALPGARELLGQLPPDRWAIVTSCDREVAVARLTEAGVPIPAVLVTPESITHGKPNPEGYRLAAELLGVDPADTVVFEDAPAGLEAAHRAGIRAIAIRHTADDQQLQSAVVIIDNPAAVTASIGETITLSVEG